MVNLVSSNIADITQRDPKAEAKTRQELSEKKIKDQKMSYLSMLTAQLTHQDPTQPVSTEQMGAQIMAMCGLELQLEGNKSLSNIEYNQGMLLQANFMNDIGKKIVYEGDSLFHKGGSSEIEYEFQTSEPMDKASIQIFDEKQHLVLQKDLEIIPGKHKFVWDGKDNGGRSVKEGIYDFRVIGSDKKKNFVSSVNVVEGVLDGIITDKSVQKLSVNGREIDFNRVKKIVENPAKQVEIS